VSLTWVFFGDDWGAHPSTTQHLARNVPEGDRLVWVDSLGMRAPRPSADDLRAIATRLAARKSAPSSSLTGGREPDVRLSLPVAPFHGTPAARAFNRRLVRAQLRRALERVGATSTVLVSSTPIAAWYVDPTRFDRIAYLRLDDYARLPGVDADWISESEPRMHEMADVLAATARDLLPEDPRALYLPQGVDVDHFRSVPSTPPRRRVLGFFGLLAEWIDYPLIETVAEAAPSWRLELLGPVRHLPASTVTHPRVTVRSAVPYAELPHAINGWDAAWIPFRVDELTRGVNPVKLREYLAAGLPTLSTPLPSAAEVGEVTIGSDAADVVRWLEHEVAADDPAARARRRLAMTSHSWQARAATLRSALAPRRKAA
jgi:glycosyltransferase involved in cell wall biosynthesis